MRKPTDQHGVHYMDLELLYPDWVYALQVEVLEQAHATHKPRLSDWDRNFLSSVTAQHNEGFQLSPKQIRVLQTIGSLANR